MAISGPTTNHNQIRRWAESHHGLPAELLPGRVNGEPLELRLYFGADMSKEKYFRKMTWEDFFSRFDLMGLSFIYDDNPSCRPHESYEILQEESRSPYAFRSKSP